MNIDPEEIEDNDRRAWLDQCANERHHDNGWNSALDAVEKEIERRENDPVGEDCDDDAFVLIEGIKSWLKEQRR